MRSIYLALILICISSISCFAYDFTVDGINYNILSDTDKTVTVTSYDNENESNVDVGFIDGEGPADAKRKLPARITSQNYDLVIPSTVRYNSTEWSVVAISRMAFLNKTHMASVCIPSSVTSIGALAFSGCVNLMKVICMAESVPTTGTECFNNVPQKEGSLVIPNGSYSLYSVAPQWKEWINFHSYTTVNNGDGTHTTTCAYCDYTNTEQCTYDGYICSVCGGNKPDTDLGSFDNVLYVENCKAKKGEQIILSLQLNNVNAISGVEFEMHLPKGLSFATDEDGLCLAQVSLKRTSLTKTNYSDQSMLSDGSLWFVFKSTKGYSFSGSSGEIANITVNINDEMKDGEYPLILKKIVLVGSNSDSYAIDEVKSTITIKSIEPGDVDGNGIINISDVKELANSILQKSDEVSGCADINNDGIINIMDLTILIRKLNK